MVPRAFFWFAEDFIIFGYLLELSCGFGQGYARSRIVVVLKGQGCGESGFGGSRFEDQFEIGIFWLKFDGIGFPVIKSQIEGLKGCDLC